MLDSWESIDNNQIKPGISLIYVTCNQFSKLWIPYFIMFKKYVKFRIKVYLCTDTDVTNEMKEKLENYNVNILVYGEESNPTKNGNFFDRMLYYLDNINDRHILYTPDDNFICNYVDENKLNRILRTMTLTSEIKLLDPTHGTNYAKKIKPLTINYDGFKYNLHNSFGFNIQLIDKLFFKEYMIYLSKNRGKCQYYNSIIEAQSSYYFKIHKFKGLVTNLIKIFGGHHGIVHYGIIPPCIVEKLKEEGIEIELYNNRLYQKIGEKYEGSEKIQKMDIYYRRINNWL